MAEEKPSWIRKHAWTSRAESGESETEALAVVYRCDGHFVADIDGPQTRVVLPGTKARLRVVCESDVQSRLVADGMVRSVHPHDCDERCEPWRTLAS